MFGFNPTNNFLVSLANFSQTAKQSIIILPQKKRAYQALF